MSPTVKRPPVKEIEAELERLFFETVNQDTSEVVAAETSGRQTVTLIGMENEAQHSKMAGRTIGSGICSTAMLSDESRDFSEALSSCLPSDGTAAKDAAPQHFNALHAGASSDSDEEMAHEASDGAGTTIYSITLESGVSYDCNVPLGSHPTDAAAPSISPITHLLASFVLQQPQLCVGKRVVDASAGPSGLCALAAARSARSVYALESDGSLFELLVDNVDLNACRIVSERLKCLQPGSPHSKDLRIPYNGAEVILLAGSAAQGYASQLPPLAQILSPSGSVVVGFEEPGREEMMQAAAAGGLQLVTTSPLGGSASVQLREVSGVQAYAALFRRQL